MVLKELIFNRFFTLGGCGDFNSLNIWKGVVVLKELIF